MKALFPIIDGEFETRLFDEDLVSEVRYDRERTANEVFNFHPWDSESYRKFKESYRAECRAQPYDSLSLKDQIALQLAFVSAMPRFNATDEEMQDENERYARFSREILAEAESVIFWNNLVG